MTRLFSGGLTLVCCLALMVSPAWSIDPRLGVGARSSVPTTNDPTYRVVAPGTGVQQISTNSTQDRLLDPTRFEYNAARPGLNDPSRLLPTLPGTGINATVAPTQPVSQNQQSKWRLGVYSKDTNTGVQIVKVVENGAAQRAGLEPNDVIISINGFQVGYVNGALYDCAPEFERSADSNGWVSMLVYDGRSRSLTNLPVQLDSRLRQLSGTLTWRDTAQLPQGAVTVVELRERARPEAPTVVIAKVTVNPNQIRQNTIPFQIEYDPAMIDSRRTYTVSAQVFSKYQEVLYQSNPAMNYQVLNLSAGQQRPVSVALERTAPYGQIPAPTTGNTTQLVTMDQFVTLFQTVLQRNPTRAEMQAYQNSINAGESYTDLQADIYAHPSVFVQANRDKQQYIQKLHEMVLGRPADAEELAYWMKRYDANQGIRSDVAREFIIANDKPN